MHITLDICIINKMLGFHYRERTTGGAEHSYRITQNVIVRDQVERQVPRLSFDPALIFGASEQNLPPPLYP